MRVLFYGSPDYTSVFLDCLASCAEVVGVVTAADKESGRGRHAHRPAPAIWAEERSIPFFQEPSLRDPRFVQTIGGLAPDLGVVVAYGRILPRALFALPKHETINIHFSLLPCFRGASPIEAALLAGAGSSGVSIQRIVEELDAGDILASREVAIDPPDHFPELFAKLMEAGQTLLPQCIRSIETGNFILTPQDASKATVCGKIHAGSRRIDWRMDAEKVYNLIRAFAGARTAWTTLRGKKVLIHRVHREPAKSPEGNADVHAAARMPQSSGVHREPAKSPEGNADVHAAARRGACIAMPQSSGVQYPAGETGEERTHILVPGAIIADKGSAHVVCGDGKRLALAEVQLENKRRVPIAECLNGLKLQAGESFT